MTDKIYIIAISGVETYRIEHVCASEDTARKRFRELKISMLQEELGYAMAEIADYTNGEWIYAEYPEEKDKWLEFSLRHYEERIKLYSACTFEKAVPSTREKPICSVYDLER